MEDSKLYKAFLDSSSGEECDDYFDDEDSADDEYEYFDVPSIFEFGNPSFVHRPYDLNDVLLFLNSQHATQISCGNLESLAAEVFSNSKRAKPSKMALAVRNGDYEEFKKLIEDGQSTQEKLLQSNWTLLHLVASCGDVEMMRLLLDHGSEVDAQDEVGSSPLHRSVARGNYECTKLLLERGADPKMANQMGITPLHIVLCTEEKSSFQIAELLLASGAETNAASRGELYPIHLAVEFRDVQYLQLLVEHGADVNQRTFQGNIPLMVAATYDKTETIKYLLDEGADPNAIDFEDGYSALFEVVARNNFDATRYMLAHGANPNQKATGGTPLAVAVLQGFQDMVSLLLSHGAKINELFGIGETVLHCAVSKNFPNLVSFLLENGADPSLKNTAQLTSIELAIQLGDRFEILSALYSRQLTSSFERRKPPSAPEPTRQK